MTSENEKEVWDFQFGDIKKEPAKLQKGDYVRISKDYGTFARGYNQQWTNEIFRIDAVTLHDRPLYKLVDLQGEPIEGSFYPEEVQKVDEPEVFKVQKVLRRRTNGKRKEIFVKWLGYPDKFNTWIPENQLKQL